jgi:hypothetical protein
MYLSLSHTRTEDHFYRHIEPHIKKQLKASLLSFSIQLLHLLSTSSPPHTIGIRSQHHVGGARQDLIDQFNRFLCSLSLDHATMSSAGPSRPPPPTASPLPQPIRRAVRAAQPQPPPTPKFRAQIPPKASVTANPRAKSVFGSFRCELLSTSLFSFRNGRGFEAIDGYRLIYSSDT